MVSEPERDRLWALFDQAADLPPAQQRALLDAACADDPGLRAAVERMLANDARLGAAEAAAFLKSPLIRSTAERPSGATPSPPVGAPPLPSQLGRYRLIRLLGAGGMGAVYEAEQDSPRRTVAVKVVRPGLASPWLLKRFHHESQILGRLHHPGIAQVYEAGLADGQPFFAMEFVRGLPLDEYARLRAPALPARLELLARVCDAVQHAHDRGVIHRDLKPANILVEEAGQPKVLDFGVARATDADLLTAAGLTQTGQLLGTPNYMSPEQVTGDPAAIDHRADVYALGVILFELAAHRLPYRLESRPLAEAARLIVEEDPPRLGSINPELRGDVETIAAKALDKDRARRYLSAAELGADLRHWLAHEPIRARPTSALYHLRKFARRHRALVGGVVATGLALVVGTVFSLLFAIGEARQRHAADRERSAAQANEEKAHAEAERARQSEAQTKAVLEFVENKIFAATRPEGQSGGLGYDISLRKAIETALPYVGESFKDQPLIEARLRRTLGNSFSYLGEPRRAVEQFKLARKLYTAHLGPDHPDTLQSMNTLANSYADLGRYADALKLHEETLALRKAKLGPDHSDTLSSMHTLANSYGTVGRYADALKLREETLARRKAKLGPDHPDTLMSMNNLASSYDILGRYADALKLHEETVALRKAKLGPDHPYTLMSMNNLANSYYTLGRHADALKLHEKTLALQKAKLGPDHPDTLWTMMDLADSYAALGRHADALKLHEKTLAMRKAKRGPDHPDTLTSMNSLALIYAALGRHAEALKLFEKTLALRKAKLGPDHPDTLKSMNNLANSYGALGRHSKALNLHEKTLSLRKAKLGPDHPHTILSMNNVARCLATVPDEKLRDPARAVELAGRAAEARPNDPSVRGTLGTARYRAGQWKGAIEDLAKTIESRKPDDPNNANEGFFIAMAHWQLGEKDKARQWFDRAAAWMAKQQTPDEELRRFRAEAGKLLGVEKK
jgi:tetratricopeptide (TPR) repeat protein